MQFLQANSSGCRRPLVFLLLCSYHFPSPIIGRPPTWEICPRLSLFFFPQHFNEKVQAYSNVGRILERIPGHLQTRFHHEHFLYLLHLMSMVRLLPPYLRSPWTLSSDTGLLSLADSFKASSPAVGTRKGLLGCGVRQWPAGRATVAEGENLLEALENLLGKGWDQSSISPVGRRYRTD